MNWLKKGLHICPQLYSTMCEKSKDLFCMLLEFILNKEIFFKTSYLNHSLKKIIKIKST